MNAKRPKLEVKATAQIGSPPGVHFRKILGALPSSERARRVREAAYYKIKNDVRISHSIPGTSQTRKQRPILTTSELAADQAAIKTIALTIEGKTLIPAFDTAIVNGLDAALPVSLNNLGSL